MIDISELLEWFERHNKPSSSIGARQNANTEIAKFLDCNLTGIIQGRTVQSYECSQLVHHLVETAIFELQFNDDKGYKNDIYFKRDAFNNAVKFLPKLILADSIDAEDPIIITWYHRICQSGHADNFVQPVLPCVTAFFSTVTPVDIPGDAVVEVWRDLWRRVRSLHSIDNLQPLSKFTNSSYLGTLLECLGAILRISKQTPLADNPWETVLAVIDGLGLRNDDVKMYQRMRVSIFPEFLRLLRVLLHQWGFTYRVQLIAAMEPMMKNIATHIEYDQNMAEWSSPWSEIKKESSPLEHAWLLLEEYASLVAPKGCPIHIPAGTLYNESALSEFAELVVKYAKAATSTRTPPCPPAACRLAARALVAQHRLQKASGSCEDEDAGGGGGGCSSQILATQLASFTKMKVNSQYSSQLAGAGMYSSQLASQMRSQMGSSQRVLKRRKRKREAKMLQSMASLDFVSLLADCTSARMEDVPVEWMRYVIECMNQVYGEHMQDLGPDAADLVQLTIASTKAVTREELVPAVSRLLCTIMEKLHGEEVGGERCLNVDDGPSTSTSSRRSSRGSSDGAAISELWSRAHSWTHMPTCFETATRLLIECDRWLLSHECSSTLPTELRWTRMIEVLKPAPRSSTAAIDLLQYLIANYEFNEKDKLKKGEESHVGKDWPFRRELIDWLLSRDVTVDISSAIVAVCSYYPKQEKVQSVDRRSSPWINQDCRVRALVRTQMDCGGQRAEGREADSRPDTLIKELVGAVVEAMGGGVADQLVELRRLCVLQRLTTRVKRTSSGVVEPPADSTNEILNESILSVKREMEVEGMKELAEKRWASCVWFESYGVRAIDTETLLRLLQHEEISDGLPDIIFASLLARRDAEEKHEDRQRLTALTSIMRQFMADLPEPDKLVCAIESMAGCSSLVLVPHTMRRLGDAAEKLAEAAESVVDVQTMIYKYGHMVQPEARARLVDKMSQLVDGEKNEGEGNCFAHHMEEIVIAHYATEIRLEYAMADMDRSDVVERVLTPESLISRLQLESDRGEMTGECEELVKASLSPGRWEDHVDTVNTVSRWPELMKRCLSTQPLLCSIMDEMAAAIDIDTVIKKEIKEEEMDADDYENQHKDYIDIENMWSPIQREISRTCAALRTKSGAEAEEQFSCSTADSSLPTALLLPRKEWPLLAREWMATMPAHALKILVDYGKRCAEIGLELRFIQILEYLIGQREMENSPYRFMFEALAEQAVWSIHGRCSVRSTDFLRASAQWVRIRSRLRPSVSPCHFRLVGVLRDRQRTFEDNDFDPECLSPLVSTPEWWERAAEKWDEDEREATASGSPSAASSLSSLSSLRSQLITAYRTLHEARCVPHTAATVLPKIAAGGGLGEMTRSNFSGASFTAWLRLHIELWMYGRRFTESSPEEIQVIMDAYEEAPLGQRRSRGDEEMTVERKMETDLVVRLLRLAHSTTTSAEWKGLLARLTTVLPALSLHYECLPFIVAICPAGEAIETVLMSAPELLQEREEERCGRVDRRGRRREEREGGTKRAGDVAVVMEECVTVVGLSCFSQVCAENGRDAEEPLADMAKLAIDSGVMSLARICIDLAAESSLPARPLFLFNPSFTLPECLEETRKAAVIATRDAVTARSLSSGTQAQEEIRRILAESRFDWHLSSSREARAALDEEEENYLLRFTQWTSFSKLRSPSSSSENSLNGALVLMQKDETASQRVVERLRSSISFRLCSTRDLLSREVSRDLRCAELLRIFEEEKETESVLPVSLVPLSSSPSLQSSHLDEDCLLRVGVELARWRRKREEEMEGGRNESFFTSPGPHLTHRRVEAAVRHLEGIRAYKPALRLLSQWSSLCDSSSVKAMVTLDEARIRVAMGEEYVGLHAIEEIKREHEGEARILTRASFLEADIVLGHSKNREKGRNIVREALNLLTELSDDSMDAEDARMLHTAHVRIFDQTAKILEETQTIMESRGFVMKREAIEDWGRQLEEIQKRNMLNEQDKKTKVRLERELACESEEVHRMERRMAELATECIVAGLDALKSAPNTKSDTAEILFPLLDVIFKYGQTHQVGDIIKAHIASSSCSYFVQGVGHIVGHVFKETPITRPLRVLLAKLVMMYPFHTLPRLLFYYNAGGAEEKNIRVIIDQAKKNREVAENVEKIIKTHFMFKDFTEADVRNRNLFTVGMVKDKKCFRMSHQVPLLRDSELLRLVPMPTVHLDVNQPIDTVPHITGVHDVFSHADGLSVPKVLTVRTSDGLESRIICKKEDVRQDAMVEHLFEAINAILQAANGGRRHQELRTYKVVPLDLNNGLIEFCGGTISLKELLCGIDRVSGLHKEVHPEDMTAREALGLMSSVLHQPTDEKVDKFRYICERFRPVFRHYFYKEYASPKEWSEKLDAYRRSLAQWSIVCYVVGLGDRHSSNVLFEPATAKFVHIDLGMILEYSKRSLPVPERVPFRLTRDLVDPLIGDALDGHFTTIAVDTIVALRNKSSVLLGIASALLRETMSNFEEAMPRKDSSLISKAAIGRLRDKLAGTDAGFAPQTPDEQVRRLIGEATDIQNLATIFHGWMPFL